MVYAVIHKCEPRASLPPHPTPFHPSIPIATPTITEATSLVPLFPSVALSGAVLLDRRLIVQLTQRESHPRCVLGHDTGEARIERQQGINNRKRTSRLGQMQTGRGVRGADELAAGQEEEGQGEEGEDEDDGDVGAQGCDEEESRDEEPGDEVDANVDGEGACVIAIGGGNATVWVDGQGEGKPES